MTDRNPMDRVIRNGHILSPVASLGWAVLLSPFRSWKDVLCGEGETVSDAETRELHELEVRAGALLMVFADIDPKYDKEFNEWYNSRHVRELVRCDGFLSGRRGVATDSDQTPRYAAIYELEDESALESKELQSLPGFGPFTDLVNYYRLILRPTGPFLIPDLHKGNQA
jgi:hypothetical protein